MADQRLEVSIRFVNDGDPDNWWDYDTMDEVINKLAAALPGGTPVDFSYIGAHTAREKSSV